jgi:iron complex outermembrane receptor protein
MKAPNRSTLFRRASTFLLVLSMALVCGTAMGQEVTEEEFLLEDIIVTSEFREKSIQDTPLAISAVNAEMIEARNQVTLDQISWHMPNVSLRPNNSGMGSSLVAVIRGVGQTDFNPSGEEGVAIYVDDVYYSTITGNILDLLDLERVEVLRGPQGTLAGRNAIGGAIKLFTRKADGSDDGFVSLTYGDYDRLDVKGAGGFTIVPDKLFARVAGVSRSRDGYVTRLDYACANNSPAPGNPGGIPTYTTTRGGLGCELGKEGGQSMTAGRFSLRWLVSDYFEVNFAANIVNDKSESQPTVLLEARGSADADRLMVVPIFIDNNGNGLYDEGDVQYDSRFVTAGTYYNYATYINDGTNFPDPNYIDLSVYTPDVLPPINHLKSEDYTLSLNWQITDNVSLLSVSSYREYLNEFSNDEDVSPLAVGQLFQRMDHEQFTQELRLNATLWDGYADLTVGGFYLDKETNEDGRVDINYAALNFLHGPDIVPSESTAFFSHIALHLSDRSDLSLGLRYSEDEKSYTFHRHNPDGTAVSPPTGYPWAPGQAPNNLVAGLDGLSTFYSDERWDWRAAIDYDFTDNIMGYAQIATGYKIGGNNARPFFPSQLHVTESEELISYEIGMKSTLADQLRLNGAIFFNDYTDIQLMANLCAWAPEGQQTPCAGVANVGDADVQGFELEGVWSPTRAFSLDFSYAYMDFEYTRLDPLANVPADSSAPYTPETKWSLGAQYTFELGDGWGDLTPRIDYYWQDEVYAAALGVTGVMIPDYGVLNGRLTWRSEDFKWEVSLEGSNITDKYYYLTIYDLYDMGTGYINGQPGRPIEWAVTIKRLWF